MGTRRRVAAWYVRRPGEFVVVLPGQKKNDPELVFSKQSQMVEFARASKLVLRQVGQGERMA